jgi:hypothetical protein
MNIAALPLNPAAIGTIALFLSVIWMLRDERDKTRPVLVLALVVNLLYGFLLNVVMGKEDGLVPWKYDHILAAMDASLGVDTPSIASALQDTRRVFLGIVYDLMVPMMIVWYIAGRYRKTSGNILSSYIAELLAGPLLYAIVPACGPIYAFRSEWLQPGAPHPELIRLSGMPNAFPSLHIATAVVFVFFARGILWRAVSLAMLAGTALATISTGEHYVIDLVAGFAFGCFAAAVGFKKISPAVFNLALALGWSLAVRFQFQFLLDQPAFLKLGAAFTVVSTVSSIAVEWMHPTRTRAEEPADGLEVPCQWEYR